MSGLLTNHLNGGKWSQEEEAYAEALILAFKAGEIPVGDIEEGTSLRKFLAEKLLCSPKRVSKKYEGTNYNGKQVYMKKTGVSPTSPTAIATKARLEVLERKFRDALATMQKTGSIANKMAQADPLLDSYSGGSGFAGVRGLTASTLPPVSSASLLFPQVRSTFLGGTSSLELAAMQRFRLDNAFLLGSSFPNNLTTLPAVRPPAAAFSSYASASGGLLDATKLQTLAALRNASLGSLQIGGFGAATTPDTFLMDTILANAGRLKRSLGDESTTAPTATTTTREVKRPRHDP
ncbi:expressed unknown protein [Seminavis robusta]|uniref:Uncharacterized protein n=2 Tax=Seminavis robusta TaxID=568900 RepID=A0A9N8EJP2_9STRA|nr:expressed unknown protein [Seminavis robusta]|eukprot:Sro1188_g250610.1 n/a (292) ;mRNA; f:23492-24458